MCCTPIRRCSTRFRRSLSGRRLGIPVVYEVRALWEDAAVDHGTTREGSARYRLSRALETAALRRVDHVTTICEGLRREIAGRGIPDGANHRHPERRRSRRVPLRREGRAGIALGARSRRRHGDRLRRIVLRLRGARPADRGARAARRAAARSSRAARRRRPAGAGASAARRRARSVLPGRVRRSRAARPGGPLLRPHRRPRLSAAPHPPHRARHAAQAARGDGAGSDAGRLRRRRARGADPGRRNGVPVCRGRCAGARTEDRRVLARRDEWPRIPRAGAPFHRNGAHVGAQRRALRAGLRCAGRHAARCRRRPEPCAASTASSSSTGSRCRPS